MVSVCLYADSKCIATRRSAKDRSRHEDIADVEGTARDKPEHTYKKWKVLVNISRHYFDNRQQ